MIQNCHSVCSCYLLKKIYPLIITVQRLTEFLLFHLVDKGYTPSTIRGYRSDIARTIHLSSCSALAKMDYLSLMVKHLCNERPKQMMFRAVWYLEIALKPFQLLPFRPLDIISLKLLFSIRFGYILQKKWTSCFCIRVS